MEKKICLKCSTENEGNYVFCKYCGAMLPVVDKRYNYPPEDENSREEVAEPEIEGISLSDMNRYVGKRPQKFIPKFLRMQALGQSSSFCAPVFILGLFFGFFGTAIWFFWRKMSKLGWLFVGLGLFLEGLDIVVNYSAYCAYMDGFFGLLGDVTRNPQKYADPGTVSDSVNSIVLALEQSFNPVISLISRYVGHLSVPSVASLFALYLYKNKAVSDIKSINESTDDIALRQQLIADKGGCSGLLILIPIFAQLFAVFGAFFICVL